MYSIAETCEDGKIYVQAVPSSWIKNDNTLYWPPDSTETANKPSTLIMKNVKPKRSWTTIKCKVLAKNIGKFFIYIRTYTSSTVAYYQYF